MTSRALLIRSQTPDAFLFLMFTFRVEEKVFLEIYGRNKPAHDFHHFKNPYDGYIKVENFVSYTEHYNTMNT